MRLYLYQQRHFLKLRVETEGKSDEDHILLPSMSLKKTLLGLKQTHSIQNLDQVFLCTQFGQHIIEQFIGSKPVFITTQGFESSAEIHRPIAQDNFTLTPKRAPSILNPDYVFGVDERVSSQGDIVSEAQLDQLEIIKSKLQLSEKQNIAIGLLNSNNNAKNEELIKNYFEENNYRCFTFKDNADLNSKNENYRWWQSIVNAYMFPPFEDLLQTLLDVFEISAEQLHLLYSNKFKKSSDENHFLFSSLSYIDLLKQQFENEESFLFFGTEDFLLIHPTKVLDSWTTDIAKVYYPHPQVEKLKIQPTQYILQDAWGCLNYGYENLNYEPGPMLMGKGLKLCFVDLLFYKGLLKTSVLSGVSQIGSLQKIDELLMTYSKKTALSPVELADEMIKLFIFQIQNTLLKSKLQKIKITGDLALDILPILKDSLKDYSFEYEEHQPIRQMQRCIK